MAIFIANLAFRQQTLFFGVKDSDVSYEVLNDDEIYEATYDEFLQEFYNGYSSLPAGINLTSSISVSTELEYNENFVAFSEDEISFLYPVAISGQFNHFGAFWDNGIEDGIGWLLANMSVSANLLDNAVSTISAEDDRVLFASLLGGNDQIFLSQSADSFDAGSGDDLLYGFGGNDTLNGGDGTDTINGGTGTDILIGGGGADVMCGGEGDDVYHVDNLNDRTLEAVSDTDVPLDIQRYFEVWLQSNPTWLEENGFGGIQLQVITSSEIFTGLQFSNPGEASGFDYWYKNVSESIDDGGEDLVYSSVTWSLGKNVENLTLTGSGAINGTGNTLNNVITGNSGNNRLTGGTGADTLIGGTGNDTYVVDNVSDKITEGLNAGTDTVQSSVTYTLAANVENLTLTGSAAINGTGNTLNNTITGNSGNNTLNGGKGNDTLSGGSGYDRLYGGSGNDVLDDGAGTDYIDGGEGIDTFQRDLSRDYTDYAFTAVVDLARGKFYALGYENDFDTLVGIEDVDMKGNFNDRVYGTTGNNTLKGNNGNDLLYGRGGNDLLHGGNDNDKLYGDTGADSLIGGTGSDLLYGGADSVRDVFIFNSIADSKTGSTRDKVYDFRTKVDDLDLRGIDANTNLTGDQKFGFNTTTAKANSVWYKVVEFDGNAKTKEIIVYGDVNGDAKADFEIGLMGVSSITASDFLL